MMLIVIFLSTMIHLKLDSYFRMFSQLHRFQCSLYCRGGLAFLSTASPAVPPSPPLVFAPLLNICVSVSRLSASVFFFLHATEDGDSAQSDPINPHTVCLRLPHSRFPSPAVLSRNFSQSPVVLHTFIFLLNVLFVDFIASLWQFNERICRRHLPSHSQPHPQPLVYTYMYPCHRVKALLGTLFFLNIKYSNILHSHTRWRHANILAYISAGKWQPKCQKASGPGAEGGCFWGDPLQHVHAA